MKNLFYISFIALLLTACGSSKKSTTSTVISSDTTVQRAVTQQSNNLEWLRYEERNDTAIGIAPKKVEDSLPEPDTKLQQAKTGKKVPVYKQKTDNGLTAWLHIDTAGNIRYGASSDSMTLVVQNLSRRMDSIVRSSKEHYTDSYSHNGIYIEKKESTSVKVRSWLAGNWYWLVIGVVGTGLFISYKLLRRQYTGR